jgi:hypothetical protein
MSEHIKTGKEIAEEIIQSPNGESFIFKLCEQWISLSYINGLPDQKVTPEQAMIIYRVVRRELEEYRSRLKEQIEIGMAYYKERGEDGSQPWDELNWVSSLLSRKEK